jgi:hypothetical protein
MVRSFSLTIVLLASCAALRAQEIPDQNDIERRIEIIAENLEEDADIDFTTLLDELTRYAEHPININGSNLDELAQLYILSDLQIANLKTHLIRHGKLDDIHELQAVDGFDKQTILLLLPFVRVSEVSELSDVGLKEIFQDGTNELYLRYIDVIEKAAGYKVDEDDSTATRYLGSSSRQYLRYRFRYKNAISFGITAEKDPGEEVFGESQSNGFDFYSAHLEYRGNGLLRQVILGDYHAQFGQGLNLWTGLGFGKSALAMNIKKSARGLRPYTSVDENLFLRGGAVSLGWKDFELTALFSQKAIDANLSDTLIDGTLPEISSFQLSGLHRTANELFDKDAIEERIAGGNVAYKKRNFKVSVSGYQVEYDADVNRNLSLYNQFDFNASKNSVIGADFSWIYKSANLFGEFSRSENGGIAWTGGALLAPHRDLSISILYRDFDIDYQNLLNFPFAESSRAQNESGLYFGSNLRINRQWNLSGYFDQFEFPWLRFRTDSPTEGHDYLLQLAYKPKRGSEFYARVRRREKSRNPSGSDVIIDFPVDETRTTCRLNADYKVSESVKFKTRAEWSWFENGNGVDKGFLMYQDIIYRPIQSPWAISMRYALFDSESYDARIYAYENDLLYVYSIPAYFSRGSRYYTMVKYKIRRGLDLWVRWSQWIYSDRTSISSGLNEIDGNTKSEIKLQLRWKF